MLLHKACATPTSGESFSAGLRSAKITEIRAKEGLCPQVSRLLPTPLAHRELHERRGEAVRCAAAFCIARFLARSLHSGLSILHSDYAFA